MWTKLEYDVIRQQCEFLHTIVNELSFPIKMGFIISIAIMPLPLGN